MPVYIRIIYCKGLVTELATHSIVHMKIDDVPAPAWHNHYLMKIDMSRIPTKYRCSIRITLCSHKSDMNDSCLNIVANTRAQAIEKKAI